VAAGEAGMRITRRFLPAFCYAERALADVSGIVIHYISAAAVAPERKFAPAAVRALFLDLNRPAESREFYRIEASDRLYASYHYLIGRRGGVCNLVPLPHVAYHAGVSEMAGRSGCNEFCVGISLVATHDSGFTESQYRRLIELIAALRAAHDIDPAAIQGHEHVARPQGRKPDPGPRFDWERLHAGINAARQGSVAWRV